MKQLQLISIAWLFCVASASGQEPRTEITKWQDGKHAAVSITFDDSTINQFRIALPLLNERGLHATFFVITGEIPGSRYHATFVGRRIMEILRGSETVPTNKDNAFERSSMLRYLGEVQRVDVVLKNFRPNSAGGQIEKGNFAPIDAVLAALRQTGETYTLKPSVPVRSQEAGRPLAAQPGGLTWDEFRRYAAQGHEFANHLVSHAHTPGLDEANILDATKYARERMRSTVTAKRVGEVIEVSVTHSLDPKLYDLPLTARTTVPADWTSVQFRQGNVTRTLPVLRETGNSYVMYRIAPNGGVARLVRGK